MKRPRRATRLSRFRSSWWFGAFLAMVAVASPSSTGAQPAPAVQGQPSFPPAGSVWVLTVKSSGSLKVNNETVTFRSLGEQTWNGQKTLVYATTNITHHVDPTTLRVIVRVRGNTPIETFDPPTGWEWPVFVGRSWVDAYRVTYESNQAFDVRMAQKVEAYEDITVPAGKFKVFRISANDGGPFKSMTWWSPEIGLSVKTTTENTFQHFRGPGWRESHLVSYELKK